MRKEFKIKDIENGFLLIRWTTGENRLGEERFYCSLTELYKDLCDEFGIERLKAFETSYEKEAV
jgi:hypothetical protein